MRKTEDYKTMIQVTLVRGISIIAPLDHKTARMFESDANKITRSLEFKTAEIARGRFERAKQYRQYNEMRLNSEIADKLYRKLYSEIQSTYGVARPKFEDTVCIDVTPLGVLLDEIEFAIRTMTPPF